MHGERPIRVAIVGGGCASMAAAFELTRPELAGKYEVTVYQMGWRLGGKGASGRGPSGRIEEHGLHIWLGFYENAFRLMRECYEELGRDPKTSPIATWRDAFFPDAHVGIADRSRDGAWVRWTASFPPMPGLPGDPVAPSDLFTIRSYVTHTASLLFTLLTGLRTHYAARAEESAPAAAGPHGGGDERTPPSIESLVALIARLPKLGALAGATALIEGAALLQLVITSIPSYPESTVLELLRTAARIARRQLEEAVAMDDDLRCRWEIIDLVLAILVGTIRFRLLYDPRGLDAIDEYECREWLRLNGASERSVNSAFVRGLYDLALAYDGGDPAKPGLAAGQALRGSFRMFFTYRGSLFWKMRAGMGDVVFSPFYEVLKRRGVRFEFFHRLENVKLSDGEQPHVEALEFDVQATIRGGGEYQPLVDVKGLPCWPSTPDWAQLDDGERLREERWRFESHWDTRRTSTRTLRVTDDFDFVVLGLSVGAIPHTCKEILARDARWRDMVANVRTVATQALQVWMREDMRALGWPEPAVTLSAFVKPFDTWADMEHVLEREAWEAPPKSVAYFCNVLADPAETPDRSHGDYPASRHDEVRRNAIGFLNDQVHHLWPAAVEKPGKFRWELLVDADGQVRSDEAAIDAQYWTANVNPTDRYVLALPGTLKYRISPLDRTYDNLTIAGDWTDAGFNEGCVEAAVMSGRLAAHALSLSPPLADIVGYDHP